MAACGGGGNGGGSASKGSALEIAVTYTGNEAEVFKEIVSDFGKESGNKVNVAEYGDDYEATLKTRMASNDLPDVFQTHGWSLMRYKEYLMPMFLLQNKSKFTVILVIKSAFNSTNGLGNILLACATCVLGLLPIIVLYLFLQKYIIEGQIDSSVK